MTIRSVSVSLLLIFTILCAAARAQDVRITEFQATNVTDIVDEDNTHQGWIEIWNPSTTTAVPLASWKLTNGTTTWNFPAVTINADEFMIIWASGKNRVAVTAPLHTNFTIPAGGGTLSLLRSNSVLASSLANYPAQTADTSWGRDEWDATTTPVQVGRYSATTPGNRNSFSGSGVAGKVIFDKLSQSFTGTLVLAISQEVADAGATIRFTTNGTVPTATSTAYTVPLNVTTTQMIRARIFKTGLLPGETESQCFLLRDATTTAFSSAMPIVVISNFGGFQPPDVGDQSGFAWVWEPAAPDNRARLTNMPTLATRIVIDRRGSSTLGNAKYNINMEARRARNDEDRAVSLMGMADGSDYVFTGPFDFDRSEIHNPFIYALSNRIGRYAPDTRLAEVFMEVNGGALNFTGTASGDYYGIYNVVEKIRRDKNRVDVHKLDTYDNSTVAQTGGFIFKVDRLDSGDSGFNAGGQSMAYYYPKEVLIKSPQRAPQATHLSTYITNFNTALQSATWNNPTTGYAAFLDIPEAIDHHLLNLWPINVDGFRLSGYWHKERGGKLVAGPIWDFDRTMFCASDSRADNPAAWIGGGDATPFFTYTWWNRLFADIDFYQKYIDRWQSLRRGAFSQANVEGLLSTLNAQMSAEAINRDVARWNMAKRAWTRPFSPFTAMPASQTAEVQRIKDWLQQRANFIDSQWVGPVTASIAEGNVVAGTQVTLSGPVGATIRYTLNGADPRPAGGAVAGGTVLTYVAGTPITINDTTRIRARAYSANFTALTGGTNPPLVSKWGGLTNVRYAVDPPAAAGNLVVTEVNYHPGNPSATELAVNPVFVDSDFEFIELRNIGATPIDLGGAQFTLGVSLTFTGDNALTLAPGAYVVVAANPSAFAARYGAVATVVGPFTGDLDNSGEQITLKAANNTTILDFTYDDVWYSNTDGNGRTLVVYDPYAAPAAFSTAANWRSSAVNKGSPGATEPNLPPTINTGASVSGLVSGVNLTAAVTDDSQPNPPRALTFAWSQNGGPGGVTFTPPDAVATTATFTLPGSYVLRLTANDSALSAIGDMTVFAKDTPTAWLARHPGIGTLEDDFDHDGASNFAEFSLGMDPSAPDVNIGPIAVLENGHLTLTYSRIKPPSAVVYAIEVADDITAFRAPNPGEVTEEILADSGITQTVKAVDSVSTAGPPARFLRLKVSPAP